MRSVFPFPGPQPIRGPRTCILDCIFAIALLLFSVRVAQPATLTGRVLDPDGRAVAKALVVVTGPLGASAETLTSGAGGFEITRLADGVYDVRVLAEGFQSSTETVALSGDDIRELTLHLRLSVISESIVVSASQVEVARSSAPASVTVITRADLAARQVETVADALRQVPGLSVARSGGRGALTSLFPRGGASNYTLVLVDGIRANSFGGAYDFAHLPVANIDRIEIVRGPQSALYGSEAIGAVVQVITRRGGGAHVDGLVEGGGEATARISVGAAGSRGRWSWGAGAERARSDGYTGITVGGERVSNDDYSRSHASGTLAYERPQRFDLALAASISRDDRGFPGPWGSDPIGAFPGVDRVARGANDNRRIGVRIAHPWSPVVRQRLEVSYADLSSDFVSRFGPSSSGTRRFDARLQEDLAITRLIGASGGVEIVHERGRSSFVTGLNGSPVPIDRRGVGLFGEARLMTSDRLNVTAGLRVEHLVRGALEADPAAFDPRPPFGRQAATSVNPKVAVSVLLTRPDAAAARPRVRAAAGTGIRPPDVFEIAFTDNPRLQPERSKSFEAGVEQQLAGGAVAIDAAAFFNRYDDLIVTVGRSMADASHYRTDNISNARARGLELSARARLPKGVTASAVYTRLATAILSVDGFDAVAPAPFAVGDELIRRPRHSGSIDLTYAAARLSAFVSLTSRSRILDLEPNYGAFGGLFFAPGYAVVDAGAAVPVRRGLELFVRVGNVTGRRYEETLGFPALGRSAIGGARVAAGR